MCETCGCTITSGNEHLIRGDGPHAHTRDGRAAVTVLEGLLTENNHQAAHNRDHLDASGVLAINLMSSPGAGKTSLLEATIRALSPRIRIAVIEGDLETENDARRIRAAGVPAVQITTGTACHLDAHLVHDALHHLDLQGLDLLFVENVGNLVCPASFDLGQHLNVALLSVPEGDDKAAKYPVMFRTADLMVITKTDLLPYLTEFDPERAKEHLRRLANDAPVIEVHTRGDGSIDPWLAWLEAALADHRQRLAQQEGTRAEGGHHHHSHHGPREHHR